MLKITVIDTPSEQKLVLEGKLATPDLAVLESAWEHALVQMTGSLSPVSD